MLDKIDHIVSIVLENRSFDHMLGFLYQDNGNKSLSGQAFDGLTGQEFNLNSMGEKVFVHPFDDADPYLYFKPGTDPAEGFLQTNNQLFQTNYPKKSQKATNSGFVTSFEKDIPMSKKQGYTIYPHTVTDNIMGVFTPKQLPILSTLAREYAVCDRWFCAAPTETQPNRGFISSATSQGYVYNSRNLFTSKTIFSALEEVGCSWKIYSDGGFSLTRTLFYDLTMKSNGKFGDFTDFREAARRGELPHFTFLDPALGTKGNDQHPPYDVAPGEHLLKDVYDILRESPNWNKTLLIITYDEHGGIYDHVTPPSNAYSPIVGNGELGFNFERLGVRVPTVLVSPLIEKGIVFRAEKQTPKGPQPLSHCSILASIEKRFGIDPLTARDANVPTVEDVLSLNTPRTDYALDGVEPPTVSDNIYTSSTPTELQQLEFDKLDSILTRLRQERAVIPNLKRYSLSSEALDVYMNEIYRDIFSSFPNELMGED